MQCLGVGGVNATSDVRHVAENMSLNRQYNRIFTKGEVFGQGL